jgi:hypothetical protein
MISIAMLYSTPEDAAAELKYLEQRGYPFSYVEMGEEPDLLLRGSGPAGA